MILFSSFSDIILIAIAVIIAIVLHEIAHGYVALWNGDPTAKVNGRLTLNPLAHFDMMGFIMLMIVGFGYAKPVPVNPYNFRHQKRGIFTVAIAGVTINIILAFISVFFFSLLGFLQVKVFGANMALMVFQRFFALLATINVNLFLFNLIPIYPLDGFRVVEAFTKFTNPVTKFLRDYGQYILIALIGLSIFVDVLNSYTSINIPAAVDILGFYISNVRGYILRGFEWFWGLIFRV